MSKLREWEKADNYPYGAFVLYTEDKKLARTMSKPKGLSGTMEYLNNGKMVAWDLIFPKKADRKYNRRLKKRLLALCE